MRPSIIAALVITAVPSAGIAQTAGTIDLPAIGLYLPQPETWVAPTESEPTVGMRISAPVPGSTSSGDGSAIIFRLDKFPAPYADLNPSFRVGVKPAGALAGKAPVKVLATLLGLSERRAGTSPLDGPRLVRVAGYDAAYVRLAYVAPGGVRASSEMWLVPRGPVMLLLCAATRADEANGTRAETQAIVDGIRIDP